MSTSSRPIAKLPNILRDREYPDSNLCLPFRKGHASAGARPNQGTELAALLFVPSFATQATLMSEPAKAAIDRMSAHSTDDGSRLRGYGIEGPRDRRSALDLRLHD